MKKKRCHGCMRLKVGVPFCEHCGHDERNCNEPHQLPAGTVLREQYLVGKVLGQGGFGITYLGWDLYLDIPVAIKEYYPNGMVVRECANSLSVTICHGDAREHFENNRERFMREAKMLARFTNVPEIVQIKNFFPANNTAYIVMEYVRGITLKEYIHRRGGKLSAAETFAILKPIMVGLSKIHKAGIIHRDISPDNIMMLPDGGAKVLDFGAVRVVSDARADKEASRSTDAIMKQGYAPLEQYQKKGALGPWTDVYALCATICYSLTGEVPPDAPARVMGAQIPFDDMPNMERRHLRALREGMEMLTTERTGDMEQLYMNFFGEAIDDDDPSDDEEDFQPGKSRKGYWIVLAAVILILAGLAAWFLTRPKTPKLSDLKPRNASWHTVDQTLWRSEI